MKWRQEYWTRVIRLRRVERVMRVMTMRAFSAAGAPVNAAITGFLQNLENVTLNIETIENVIFDKENVIFNIKIEG